MLYTVCLVLQAMSELSQQQAEVKQLAQSSLETLQEVYSYYLFAPSSGCPSLTFPQAQQEAEEREREMAARQEGVREKIATNLEHLAQEKVLISTGQQLLANMTSDIREKLGQCCVHHQSVSTYTVCVCV